MKYLCLIYEDQSQWSKMPEGRVGQDDGRIRCLYSGHSEEWPLPWRQRTSADQRRDHSAGAPGQGRHDDGPFAETKEQLAGYYLVEARD